VVIHKVGASPGPAGRWLIERFIDQRVQPKMRSAKRTSRPAATKRPGRIPK
jgi:hypothetical protein